MCCLDRKTVKTKDGRTLEMVCYEPPLPGWLSESFFSLKTHTDPWKTDWEIRTAGRLAGRSRDRFFFGLIDDRLAAVMWYGLGRHFATYGGVYTREEFRGCGISSRLLQFALDRMDGEEGLVATYLGVSRPVPQAMYGRWGWELYQGSPGCWIMRRFRNNRTIPDFDRDYFTGEGGYRVRAGERSDLPALEALYNLTLPGGWYGRNRLHGIHFGTAIECQIHAMFNEADRGAAATALLEDSRGHVLGSAFLREGEFDFFVSPGAVGGGARLIEFVLAGRSGLRSIQSSCDGAKIDLLTSAGFEIADRRSADDAGEGSSCDEIYLVRN